ncbi:MAG: hypothetical protein ACE5HV_01075 [Acidobacteriota bacterium]
MPSSEPCQLSTVTEIIERLDPRSLLDVGVGFGKYAMLAREYLEMRGHPNVKRERYDYEDWQVRIEGIEIYEGYLKPHHEIFYDRIHVGDARQIVPTLTARFDLGLLIDVIEHFTRKDGQPLLDGLLDRCRWVLVTTPKRFLQQASVFGNPHEKHLSYWSRAALRSRGRTCFLPDRKSRVCLLTRTEPSNANPFRTRLRVKRRLEAVLERVGLHAPLVRWKRARLGR